MSALEKRLHLNKLPPRPPPGVGGKGKMKMPVHKRRDYTPISWEEYFDHMEDVQINNDTFRVYMRGSDGPVLLFLHGGGFCGLTWAVLTRSLTRLVNCQCVAIDLRGHGDTKTEDEEDLSADRMAQDVGDVVHALYGDKSPPIMLIGHSMGGAIAVHAAKDHRVPGLIGLGVIDVVEGTALEALTSMQSFLRGRPQAFDKLETAIEWCVRTGQIRNHESARISMAGQLKIRNHEHTAADEFAEELVSSPHTTASPTVGASATITEEDEEGGGKSTEETAKNTEFKEPSSAPTPKYVWRIDLSKTEKYWEGWFRGLSQHFLSCDVPKLLMLAGVDRLDKDLTVGQMQGKFQMQVLPQCGHAVHEDAPDKVAEVLATFMIRHRAATPTVNFKPSFPAC
ncbi:unnamed protein product [Owenia fusiformis]|uniref:Protein phosphatase methylesterase 1 n=1 Tax=Owenia fusiformis TaxID=6347 RepID=A0A8J1XN44_OWEFU|nr:unnamed protein product [Owenia fusiformis]